MPNAVSFEPTLDENGDPIEGGDATDAFAASNLRFTQEGEQHFNTIYHRCIVLAPGESILAITHQTTVAAFPAQQAARDELLEGLTLR